MSQLINTAILLQLASTRAQEIAAVHGVNNTPLKQEILEVKQEESKKIRRESAKVIVSLEAAAETFINNVAAEVAKLESEIAMKNKLMASVRTAITYGYTEENFIPLAGVIGQGVPSNLPDEVSRVVPKGWTPPAEAVAAAAPGAAPAAQS